MKHDELPLSGLIGVGELIWFFKVSASPTKTLCDQGHMGHTPHQSHLTSHTSDPCIYCSGEHKQEVLTKSKIDFIFAIYDLLIYKGLMTFCEFSFPEKFSDEVLVKPGGD